MPEKRTKNCVDCSAPITRRATRCRPCSYKYRAVNSEFRKSVSDAQKKVAQRPGHKEKMSEIAKSAWQRGCYNSDETRRKQSQSSKDVWQRDGYREKMSQVLSEKWKNDLYRERVISGVKKYWTEEKRKQKAVDVLGENNPNWNGGTSFHDYPIEFNDILKRKVRERDNYTCQLCGVVCDGKTQFDVHHIDYDKDNCDMNNLITLCVYCHPTTNAIEKRDCFTKTFKEILDEKNS